MVVLKGPADATMALVAGLHRGEGPYSFALDTGASRTTVDSKIAEELGLLTAGGETQVTGVGGKAIARPVRVRVGALRKLTSPPRRSMPWTCPTAPRAAGPARLRHPE